MKNASRPVSGQTTRTAWGRATRPSRRWRTAAACGCAGWRRPDLRPLTQRRTWMPLLSGIARGRSGWRTGMRRRGFAGWTDRSVGLAEGCPETAAESRRCTLGRAKTGVQLARASAPSRCNVRRWPRPPGALRAGHTTGGPAASLGTAPPGHPGAGQVSCTQSAWSILARVALGLLKRIPPSDRPARPRNLNNSAAAPILVRAATVSR
jgi:hypothetical protein